MSFRFSLAAVLRLRESVERREYLALEKIHQQIAQLQAAAARLDQEFQTQAQVRAAALSRGTPAYHLQCLAECERELQRRIETLASKLQELELQRQQQQQAYDQARQKHELLRGVRQRQLDAYQRDASRREQKNQDELFLARKRSEK